MILCTCTICLFEPTDFTKKTVCNEFFYEMQFGFTLLAYCISTWKSSKNITTPIYSQIDAKLNVFKIENELSINIYNIYKRRK